MFSNHRMIKIGLLACVLFLTVTMISVLAIPVSRYAQADPLQEETILDDTLLSSNAFTQPDDLTVVEALLTIPDTYIKVAETDSLILYMEEGSYAIRIVNKNDGENGFIHGSSFGKIGDNYAYLGTKWEENVNSAVIISYYVYNEENGEYTIVEESFLSSEASLSDYRLIDNGFIARLHFGQSGIELTLMVYLDGDYLRVEIPNDAIVEDKYQLRSIKVYPFMGSVLEDSVPGYIFVPDGSGALIRYQALNVHTDTYNFQYYGTDEAITEKTEAEPILLFPITGVVQGINQHAFMTIVEDGAAFANFSVSPAKTTLRYYYSFNEFRYRNLYQTPRSESQSESQTGTQVTEDERNSCNIKLSYYFLSGNQANYVGMANAYREYLLEHNLIHDQVDESTRQSVMLEVIGNEKTSGFIFDETLVMTDFNELSQIITELSESLDGINVVYKGYTSEGATGSGLLYDSISRSLGTRLDFSNLLSTASELGVDLAFYMDVGRVYEDGSFNLYKDIVQRINQNLLKKQGITQSYYYVAADRLKTPYEKSIEELTAYGITRVAIDTLPYTLYSDYKDSSQSIDRSEMMTLIQELFTDSIVSTLMYQPNDYMLSYAAASLSTPMTSSRYRIYSDTVPFVSYVLAGVMESYSPFMNFSSSSTLDLLKMVDYNLRPAYIITQASAYALQDSELGQIYSSSYATWKTPIQEHATWVADALDSFINHSIVERLVLSSGINKITYDNGAMIYINYTNKPYIEGALTVNERSYKVVNPNA